MTRFPRTWLFAMALIPNNTPLRERLEILGHHLTPRPDQPLEIDDAQLRDGAVVSKKIGRLYGTVLISPPKGTCFTVTTDPHRPDVEVCKPTHLKWFLEDINRQDSTVSWSIKTSATDFGTPITWTVPYVIAKTLPYDSTFYSMNSEPVFFKSCVPSLAQADGTLRKITLTQFDNTKWVIRFPDIDEPIPVKAPPLPPPVEDPKKKGGEEHGEKKDEHGEKRENLFAPKPVEEEPEPWTINTGRGFEMNVGNFISDGSMPPGKKGSCRYVYDYIPKNFSRGRIECHHTDHFLYFYVFLSCMELIIPK